LTTAAFLALVVWLLWPHLNGHAARVATVAGAAVAGLLVGASRVYLGYHWATDVLAAWLVTAAWVGNVSEGLGHCYRRAAEQAVPRPIVIHDHTNFSIALALWAAAWNAPYIPSRTLLGSDILNRNPSLEVDGDIVRIHAVRPDVAIVHVQRCDAQGHAHAWGPMGIAEEAGLAASSVIVSCEDLIDPARLLKHPNRILFPESKVVAVVHEPGGAHPSPVQGYFGRDHGFYREYAQASRTREGFEAWLKRWVLDVPDRSTYLSRIDLGALRIDD
jgi:glutaconate CoA-transferase subunit A